jgi:hypothetical protein
VVAAVGWRLALMAADRFQRSRDAGGERDVHRAVQDRAQVPHGAGQRLAQLDDDARVAVAQAGQDGAEVERAGAEGAAQDDGAADLARDCRDLVAGGLDGIEYALGGGLQGRSVLGDRDRRDGPVEQGHPEFVLEAGDGARHGRLDDVDLAGGGGEAPGLAAGEEVLQVADLHGVKLRLGRVGINGIDEATGNQSLDTMGCAAVQGRSLPGLSTAQMCLMRSPTISNA